MLAGDATGFGDWTWRLDWREWEADEAVKRWNHPLRTVEAAFSPYTPYKRSGGGK